MSKTDGQKIKANSLSARQILLIRPQRQDDQLIEILEKAGAAVTHNPVMAIEPVEENPQIKGQVLELDNFHKGIFVSGNAVELGLS